MKHVLVLLIASAAISGIAAVAASARSRPPVATTSQPVSVVAN